MNRGVLADAGPLYAAADPADQYHDRARTDLERLGGERRPVVVSYPTLIESQGLVLRRLGTQASTRWLTQVVAEVVLVNPADEDYLDAVALLGSFPDQRLTLTDAVVAVISRNLGLAVWTFDHHFDVMRVPVWR